MMMGPHLLILFVLVASPACADTLIAARTIPARSILSEQDLSRLGQTVPGTLTDAADAIGKQARVVLYAGRPIRPEDIGPPAVIRRNQLVSLLYQRGGLSILVEGRALGSAGVGEDIRVMNTASHSLVRGRVAADGSVIVATNARGGDG